LEHLSDVHASVLARGSAPSEKERARFRAQYDVVMPWLESEMAEYGRIVDEIYPDVFEPWYGAECEREYAATREGLGDGLMSKARRLWLIVGEGWRARGGRIERR